MRVLVSGHRYALANLESEGETILQFYQDPALHDGVGADGPSCQEVLRAVIERVQELNRERPWEGNAQIIYDLRHAIAGFEARALIRRVEKDGLEIETLPIAADGHLLLASVDRSGEAGRRPTYSSFSPYPTGGPMNARDVEAAAKAIAEPILREFDSFPHREPFIWEKVDAKDQEKLREIARVALSSSPPTCEGGGRITQADREAAANVALAYRGQRNGNWQDRIRKGLADDGAIVQAFAAHRLAALASAAGDPRDDPAHPDHDAVCGWCGKKHDATLPASALNPDDADLEAVELDAIGDLRCVLASLKEGGHHG